MAHVQPSHGCEALGVCPAVNDRQKFHQAVLMCSCVMDKKPQRMDMRSAGILCYIAELVVQETETEWLFCWAVHVSVPTLHYTT